MKTIFCIIISLLALVMSGCSNAVSESDMPDIVFKKCTIYQYEQHFIDDETAYALAFIDKNGDFYSSDNIEIYFLSNEELIEALRSGDERITKSSESRNTDELLENYKNCSRQPPTRIISWNIPRSCLLLNMII